MHAEAAAAAAVGLSDMRGQFIVNRGMLIIYAFVLVRLSLWNVVTWRLKTNSYWRHRHCLHTMLSL